MATLRAGRSRDAEGKRSSRAGAGPAIGATSATRRLRSGLRPVAAALDDAHDARERGPRPLGSSALAAAMGWAARGRRARPSIRQVCHLAPPTRGRVGLAGPD